MKRFLILAVVGAGVLALPGSASAISDCSYTGNTTDPVVVYTSGGRTGSAIAGVCVDGSNAPNPPGNPTPFDGGYVEVGAGSDADTGDAPVPDAYAVIDGSDANPAGQAQGYGGISTWESSSAGNSGCPNISPTGSNSGGCFIIRNGTTPIVTVPGVPIACGNTTGPDWYSNPQPPYTGRDGCSVP